MEAHKRLHNATQYLGHSVWRLARLHEIQMLQKLVITLWYALHNIQVNNGDQITHDIVGNDVTYS